MGSHLLRFLIKCKGWIVFIVLIGSLVGAYFLLLNSLVHRFIPAFVDLMAQRLNVNITFYNVHYSFPRGIILNNVRIFDKQNSSGPMLEAPQLTLGFALPLFFSQEKIHLNQITLEHMTIHATALKNYVTHDGSRLWKEFRALPDADIQIQLANTQLYLFKSDQIVAPIVFDMDFEVHRGKFIGKFKDEHAFLQFWGSWQKNSGLDWKGYMFYNGPLAPAPLYILDINSRVVIRNSDIVLEKLSFFINGDKVSATGHCLLDKPYQFQTDISYNKQDRHVTVQNPLRNLTVNLYGQLGPQVVEVNGCLSVDLFSNLKLNMPLQKGSLAFRNLQARVINDSLLRLKAQESQALFWAYDRQYKVSSENLLASIKRDGKAKFMTALSMQLYGGNYRGQVMVDTAPSPWQVKARGKFNQIDVSQLSELLSYFKKCSGYLSGSFEVQGPKNSSLTGTLVMREGNIEDFNVLTWAVSKIFQMPSLDHLSGANLFLHFKLDPQTINVEDLKLRTHDLSLNGFFRLGSNDLIYSKVSILFSQQLFNESPIGQKVVRLVPRAWDMPFEFRLSGDVHRMNFQWDDSILKRKVEQLLPNFIKRNIERRVNEKMPI